MSLNYGAAGKFSCEIDASRVLASFDAPAPNADFRAEIRRALESPLDFPPLEQALIPDDHVTVALDCHVPEAPALIAEVWRIFQRRGIAANNVTIVQPRNPNANGTSADPRKSSRLPRAATSTGFSTILWRKTPARIWQRRRRDSGFTWRAPSLMPTS